MHAGQFADVVVWDLPHENAIVQPWGGPRAARVWRDRVALVRGEGG